jgi:hypothetical protein
MSGGKTDRVTTDGNGFYKFENLDTGKSYKVIPSKAGYIFDPAQKVIERLKENVTQNFTGNPITLYSISGYVKTANGSAIKGVIINVVTTISSKLWKAITDSLGFYKLENLIGGVTYTIVPTKQNHSFDPATKTFEKLSENKTQNFTIIPAPLYSISGVVNDNNSLPIKDVIMVLNGEKQLKVTTDAGGSYKFENLPGGKNYTIFPFKLGYVFDPKTKTFENLNENKTQNFTGSTAPKFSISGYVKDKNSQSIGCVSMTIVGGSNISTSVKEMKVLTDSVTGFYKFENLETGTYTLIPVKKAYTFDPKSKVFENLNENKTQDFTGNTLPTYTITGSVKDKNAKPIDSVNMALLGGREMKAQTNSTTGLYKFENVEGGRYYTIIPVKKGYLFDPKFKTIENLNSNTEQNFIATAVSLLSINGYVKDQNSAPISGITVVLTGEKQGKTTTDNNGFYKFENLEAGRSYIILPSGKGYSFEPKAKTFENLTENKTQDFIGTPIPLYSIEGYVIDSSSAAIPGVAMRLAGGKETKVETDPTGYYKFDSLTAGKLYLLIPSRRGIVFNPKYKIFENLNDNVSQDFTGTKIIPGEFMSLNLSFKNEIPELSNISFANPSYAIMGFVQDVNSSFISGATMLLNGDEQIKIQTDENGFYLFDNLDEGRQYTLTSTKSGFVFDPQTITFDDLNENQAQFFLASTISVTGVKEIINIIPKETKLYPNYPNPFNPSTMIRYELPESQRINIQVFDLIGRLVTTLYNDNQTAGMHEIHFESRQLSSGTYFVRLQGNSFLKTICLKLIK